MLRLPPLARIAEREGAYRTRIAELEARHTALKPRLQPGFAVAHWVDHLWCDIHGVFVRGWAHAYERPVRRVGLRSGDHRVATGEFIARPDVAAHYPDHAGAARSGFALYLPCPPFAPAFLDIETDDGVVSVPLDLPPHLQRQEPYPPLPPRAIEPFIAEMKARRGAVLEIGARIVGPESFARIAEFTPECRYVGCDIHAAPGVDLVADAHALSAATGCGAFDGIFSVAVMEHIAAPWIVAAEINRALRPGGLTFHVMPHTYPLHETPNDFWRYSDEALKILFGPATGFEIVAAGLRKPIMMAPYPEWRDLQAMEMTSLPGYSTAHVLARKVAELPDGAIAMPAGFDFAARSRAYPAHGAATGDSE